MKLLVTVRSSIRRQGTLNVVRLLLLGSSVTVLMTIASSV